MIIPDNANLQPGAAPDFLINIGYGIMATRYDSVNINDESLHIVAALTQPNILDL